DFWTPPERLAAAGLVGLALLSLAIMIVGAVALRWWGVGLLLIALVAITFRDFLAWWGELFSWLRGGLPADRWSRFLAWFVLLMLVLTWLLALMPPSKWDVLTYHLAGPEQYVERGRFYAVENNHFLGFPQLVDTLFAGQIALTGRLTGAALIHWGIGVLLLLAAGGYAARRSGEVAGWLTVSMLLAAKSVWLEMTFAYVDLMPMGLAVVALSLIDQWLGYGDAVHENPDHDVPSGRDWRIVVLVGALVGFGLGVKYSVLWMGAAFGLLVLWLTRRDGWLRALGYAAVLGVVAGIVFLPWLIRNALWYDNPVYPLVFESAEMDTIRQDWYNQPESGLIYSSDAWQLPVFPLVITILGVEAAGAYGTDIGPFFLMLIPLLLLSWKQFNVAERATVVRTLLIAGCVAVAWILSAAFGSYISRQTRLVFYLFAPLAIAVGIGFHALRKLPKKPFDLQFVLRALVALILVFTLIDAVRFVNNSGLNHYFSGKQDYDTRYLEHTLSWHYVTMQEINTLPEGTTVRFLWEPRYLYCDNERLNCHPDSLMDAWYYARRTVDDGSPDAIAQHWQGDGADYLLVYEAGRDHEQENAALYTDADWDVWFAFVDQQLVEEWRNGAADNVQYVLYRWRE
ncbi:MAG: hypothetical protein K8S97_07830, partial [Anaerolineae bacterium]|nr:hypothetical protein [Anaerolineae bacterium]